MLISLMFMYFSQSMMMSMISISYSMFMKFINFKMIIEWNIFNINSNQINMIFLIDWQLMFFLSTILFISSMIMIYSSKYMSNNSSTKKFSWLIILFITSMILMILSPSPLSIILGWDMLGFTSYCLVMFFQNYKSFNASMITILSNRIGDITLILSIILISQNGSWNLMSSSKLMKFNILILTLLLICSMTKSAQIPFSSWLPQAMAAPTPISALVHSSTLVTAGIYILMRWSKIFNMINMNLSISIISSLTMLMSGIMANLEFDLKKIIALSTLSQMAFMMFTISINKPQLTFFHLIIHAIFKSMMFMCAGIMIHNMNNNQDIRMMSNLNKQNPLITMMFSIASLSLSGLLFLSGFYSKDLIIDNLFMIKTNMFILIMFIIASSLTFSYSIRLILFLYFFKTKMITNYQSHNNWTMNLSMITSLILSINFGSVTMFTLLNKENIIIIPMKLKLTMLFMLIFMMLININLTYINKINFIYVNWMKMKNFISLMWFLDLLIKNYYLMFFNSKNFNIYMEKSWIEYWSLNLINFMIKSLKINHNYLMINLFWIIFILLIMNLMLFISV